MFYGTSPESVTSRSLILAPSPVAFPSVGFFFCCLASYNFSVMGFVSFYDILLFCEGSECAWEERQGAQSGIVGEETVIKTYCIKKESAFSKRGKMHWSVFKANPPTKITLNHINI